MASFPPGATLKAPPRLVANQVARWNGTEWEVLAERPAPFQQVPFKVTRRQARQALRLAGLLHLVQPAIDAIPDPVHRDMAQIEWDDSLEFERYRPLVIQIGLALGLDDAALDQLFITAATL